MQECRDAAVYSALVQLHVHLFLAPDIDLFGKDFLLIHLIFTTGPASSLSEFL